MKRLLIWIMILFFIGVSAGAAISLIARGFGTGKCRHGDPVIAIASAMPLFGCPVRR